MTVVFFKFKRSGANCPINQLNVHPPQTVLTSDLYSPVVIPGEEDHSLAKDPQTDGSAF
jgi:hypothetical protein